MMSLNYLMKYLNWRRAKILIKLNAGQIKRIEEARSYYMATGELVWDKHGFLVATTIPPKPHIFETLL